MWQPGALGNLRMRNNRVPHFSRPLREVGSKAVDSGVGSTGRDSGTSMISKSQEETEVSFRLEE